MILALKRVPAIYLVGFMGSGKSSVGRILAGELGWRFIDIDEEIERERQKTIAEIFDTLGEAEFRRIEADAIRRRVTDASRGCPLVAALGGGAYTIEQNRELLDTHGITIWLDCSLELVHKRIDGGSHRPLARDPKKLEQLYYARREAYAKAHFRIEIVENNSRAAAMEILKLPIF